MKPILLLHGAIGAQDQLNPLLQALEALQYKVYTMSFSGHFKQAFQPAFGIEQFAQEVERFITVQQLRQPPVFGYSMGGYVALYLAGQRPGLLGDIITLGTKFLWTPEIAAKEVSMLDPATILEKVPKFAAALNQRHGASWVELLHKTQALMVALGAENVLNNDHLKSICNRVLLGLADGDTMVTEAETQVVCDAIKEARRFMLSGAKHPVETVNAEQLAALLHQFIGNH